MTDQIPSYEDFAVRKNYTKRENPWATFERTNPTVAADVKRRIMSNGNVVGLLDYIKTYFGFTGDRNTINLLKRSWKDAEVEQAGALVS